MITFAVVFGIVQGLVLSFCVIAGVLIQLGVFDRLPSDQVEQIKAMYYREVLEDWDERSTSRH